MDATLETTIRDRIEAEKARAEPPADAVAVPLIPTGRYTAPAFHELERSRVFARTWLFVGHESESSAATTAFCAGSPTPAVPGARR